MSYKYDPYTDTFTHIDDEESIVAALPIPTTTSGIYATVNVKQFELTDDYIERIADAVVRKLREMEHE